MAYTPTNWVTGDTVTATKMNKLEQGVANAGGGDILFDIANEDGTLDKTWTEILTASTAGKIARIIFNDDGISVAEYVTAVTNEEGTYFVYVLGNQGWYQTSSANGYPQFAD